MPPGIGVYTSMASGDGAGIHRLEVPADKLAQNCDPDDLGFETTDTVAPLEGTIGQERALSALELALDIDDRGFNLFISGIPGTGRNTALKVHLQREAAKKPTPPDLGYVHNFQGPPSSRWRLASRVA